MLDKIDIEEIKKIAFIAGDAIMKIYEKDFIVEYKDDKSPLTQADLKSNEIIHILYEQKWQISISLLDSL